MRDALSCLLRVFPFLMRLYLRDVWVPARRRCQRSADYYSGGGSWTAKESKRFKNCLAVYGDEVGPSSTSYDGFPQRFAHEFPGKSVEQIRQRLQALLPALQLMESCRISFQLHWLIEHEVGDSDSSGSSSPSSSSSDASVAPCCIWTEEEDEYDDLSSSTAAKLHVLFRSSVRLEILRRFLRGMDIYGEGDWNRISANVVFTKSPSQLKCHAEEYLSSKDSPTSPKRRRIIYDSDVDDDNEP
ncbi:hypothetical protein BT93_G1837 [Corymbia citriodora subsp. variegata]|nr:hypothetical protein BT93_G1837 [Corymbia citriodora subsp. variegata]